MGRGEYEGYEVYQNPLSLATRSVKLGHFLSFWVTLQKEKYVHISLSVTYPNWL